MCVVSTFIVVYIENLNTLYFEQVILNINKICFLNKLSKWKVENIFSMIYYSNSKKTFYLFVFYVNL